ncbi:hypothetical protein [Actibacterium sp.]|uniref:hypothetical protein n=1 Tax=Actibacterium sp. TaxID=1872125 RepID=UPI00356AD4CB
MQVVFHLGAHFTDEDRLLKCLLKNRGPLSQDGIIVPGPGRYRKILRDARAQLRGQAATPEQYEEVLDAILDDEKADRLIFSNHAFLSAPSKVLRDGQLYPDAGEKAFALTQIFAQTDVEMFIAVRNPATFIPTVFENCPDVGFDEFMAGADPRNLRWSSVIQNLRDTNPGVELTVWSNEDTPLIWYELLKELSGYDRPSELEGADDFLASIMSPSGMTRMHAYLDKHPPANEIQRRRIVAAFLDKFALPEEVEMELDLPGWTEDLVEDITENYEEDLFEIERMPGVNFITP